MHILALAYFITDRTTSYVVSLFFFFFLFTAAITRHLPPIIVGPTAAPASAQWQQAKPHLTCRKLRPKTTSPSDSAAAAPAYGNTTANHSHHAKPVNRIPATNGLLNRSSGAFCILADFFFFLFFLRACRRAACMRALLSRYARQQLTSDNRAVSKFTVQFVTTRQTDSWRSWRAVPSVPASASQLVVVAVLYSTSSRGGGGNACMHTWRDGEACFPFSLTCLARFSQSS